METQHRNNKTICHLSTVHRGYDARIWERECVTLARAGFDVHLLVPDDADQTYKDVQVHALHKPETRAARFLSGKNAVLKAFELQPALIHFHDPELIPVMLRLKYKHAIKVIFDCHEDTLSHILLKEYLPEAVKPVLRKAIGYYFKKAARSFDAVITADEGVEAQFKKWGAQTATLFNFPPRDIYRNEPEWDFASRPYDVIYPGSTPRYHLETMFRIARELKNRGRDTRWLILTNLRFSDAETWVQSKSAELSLQGSFDFRPQVPLSELPGNLQMARIGIIPLPDAPKFHKNIPSKLFDYFLAGLPVVLSDLPPGRQFVRKRDIALSIKANDISGFATAIEKLLADSNRMTEMGKKARAIAMKNFTWESQTPKLLNLYARLMNHASQSLPAVAVGNSSSSRQ